MALVKGPFDIEWGGNTLAGVEEVSVDYEQDTEEFETIQGSSYEVEGAISATVTVTFLESDIPSLAAVLPQHFVANGETFSTGETISHADGGIEIVASACEAEVTYNNLDIISCENPGHVLRLVNARTRLSGVSIEDRLRRVEVTFIAEPASTEAYLQFFRDGTIAVVS